jgi:membrane protein
LLVIIIAVAGLAIGREAAHGRIVEQVAALIGREGAEAVGQMVAQASEPASGIIATLSGMFAIFLGATGVFGELQSGLNQIWDVPPSRRGMRGMLKHRLTSFSLVLGMGFLLLVSLIVSAVVTAVNTWLLAYLPALGIILRLAQVVVSIGVVTLLFAMIFRFLPDVRIEWSDVWTGAAATAVLFTVGQIAIGFYLGRSAVASVYGAAGSLVLILVWVYYSSQILFFGAEFTQVYARRHGSHSPSA